MYSTPYHLQTNGLVEQFNKTLCESLAKLNDGNNWDILISLVLFYLVYGREAKLLISFNPLDEIIEENILDRLFHLVDDLPHIRESAKQQVRKVQQKQKQRYDQHITRSQAYQIGNKVLLYRAEKDKQ